MVEVADIFRQYGEDYRSNHKLPLHILKTMSAIEDCRTAKLGGHVDECDHCGYLNISYNSCRNRHCPKCQWNTKEKWIEERKKDLLPIKYYHMVFTIPDDLYGVAFLNQKIVYDILFRSVSETLLQLGRDPKHLGASIGFTAILHTWGQNLLYHPHIHCVLPGGGLSLDEKSWTECRNDFFIPVKVLSRLFRGKLLFYLKQSYGKLQIGTEINQDEFQSLINGLYEKEWVVYCKPPFGNAEKTLEYLGRYTHRVAISNERINSFQEGRVSFKWRDYRDRNKSKIMTVDAAEFIRRFLMHVLPESFVKIRHYGILSNRNRNSKLKTCKGLLGIKEKGIDEINEEIDETERHLCLPYLS